MKTPTSCPKGGRWAWSHLAATLALAIGFLLLGFGWSSLPALNSASPLPFEGASLKETTPATSVINANPDITRRSRASRIGRARATDPETVRDLVSDSAAGLRAWAEKEPAAAAAWVERVGSVHATPRAFGVVACAWADKDLPAAAAWVENIPNAEDRSAASRAVAYEAVRTDPAEAIRLASDLPEGEDKLRLMVHAVRQWTLQDNQAALEWAIAIPDPKTSDTLISAIAIELAEADREFALGLVALLNDPELHANAMAAVDQRLVVARSDIPGE